MRLQLESEIYSAIWYDKPRVYRTLLWVNDGNGGELHSASWTHLDSAKKQNELILDSVHNFPSNKELIEWRYYQRLEKLNLD